MSAPSHKLVPFSQGWSILEPSPLCTTSSRISVQYASVVSHSYATSQGPRHFAIANIWAANPTESWPDMQSLPSVEGLLVAPTENPPVIDAAPHVPWDSVVQWLPEINRYRCLFPVHSSVCGLATREKSSMKRHISLHFSRAQ